MTRLLVSVRNAVEAIDALAGGAEVIDIKEPSRGSLGRADGDVVRDVVDVVGDRAPLSMAIGELCDLKPTFAGFSWQGLSYAKVGLAKCQSDAGWRSRLQAVWQAFPAHVAPVAVIYADWQPAEAPPPQAILKVALASSVQHVLIDTYCKSTGRLLDHWPLVSLRQFSEQLTACNCKLVLAGSLDLPSVSKLLPLQPWALAVRGAACVGGRESAVSAELVEQLRREISRDCCSSSN